MHFDTDYWHALDRAPPMELRNISPAYIGMSTHPAKDQLQELRAKIFQGASEIELGFFGRGKGSRGQPGGATPESYGKNEREAMREMARLNDVGLTVHAAPDAGSMSGLGQRGFAEENRENALHEIERAIDFAADTTNGGAVVLHMQEFPRPIFKKSPLLEAYPGEEKKAHEYLIDNKTGQLIHTVKRDQLFVTPVWKMKDDKYVDEYGKETDFDHRVPEIDTATSTIKTEKRDWDYFVKETEEWNKAHEKDKGFVPKSAAQRIYLATEEVRRLEAESRAREYTEAYKEQVELKEKVVEKLKFWEEFWPKMDEDMKKRVMEQERQQRQLHYLEPKEAEPPTGYLKEELRKIDVNVERTRQAAMAYSEAAQMIKAESERVVPLEEFGKEKAAETIARAAEFAWKREKERGLDKPLFVAPENLWGDSYGSHPAELKEIVKLSRKAMVRRLVDNEKMDAGEAQKIADDHIKATFDIGHAHVWRKYFKGTDEEYKKWLIGEVEELAKDKIIGHVHVSDNFGYEDEHLTSGMGTAPIREFIETLEKNKYPGKIVAEAGGQPEGRAWEVHPYAMKALGTQVYRIDSVQKGWSDLENSYLGRTHMPGYLVGDMLPSKDWSSWSEVPFE